MPVVRGLLNVHQPPSLHLPVKEFFERFPQEDLTLVDAVREQMLHDIIVPLCLRCKHLMKGLKVSYWLRHYNTSTTALHVGPKEHLIAVVKGNLKVSLVSALYSEEILSVARLSRNFNQGR